MDNHRVWKFQRPGPFWSVLIFQLYRGSICQQAICTIRISPLFGDQCFVASAWPFFFAWSLSEFWNLRAGYFAYKSFPNLSSILPIKTKT